jgi:hypothetical protein
LSKLFTLGTLFKDRKRNTLSSQDAETTQLRNKPKNEIFWNEKKKKSNSQRKCRIKEKPKNRCFKKRLIIQTKSSSTINTEAKCNFHNHKQIISETFYELNIQVKATEKIVFNLCSTQDAAPFRKYKQTVDMFNILQGETIPMACSSFFSIILNKQPAEWDKNNYLSSSLCLFGKQFRNVRKNDLPPQVAEPNQLKNGFMKKLLKRKKLYQRWKINQGIEAEKRQAEIVLWKEEKHQLSELKFLLVDLIMEFFVLFKKHEFLPKNFSTGGERSSLENIGTIFIAQKFHWTNGYCVSPSSLDDD